MKPRTTEEEWLKARTLIDLDLYRSAWNHYRKWRLFGAACCRRALLLAPDERLSRLADTVELFADETLTWDEMKSSRKVLAAVRKELGEEFGPDEMKHDVIDSLDRASGKKPLDALGAAQKAAYAFAAASRPNWDASNASEERTQVQLVRDIFGNPFRPVSFSPEWRTSDVVSIAQSMYDSRDFSPMSILADALQDAGCEHNDILAHCRDENGIHVRGCWVVDGVLGKS